MQHISISEKRSMSRIYRQIHVNLASAIADAKAYKPRLLQYFASYMSDRQ